MPRHSLAQHAARLRAVFNRLLLVPIGTPALMGCGGATGSKEAGASDATVGADARVDDAGATGDADATVGGDAGVDAAIDDAAEAGNTDATADGPVTCDDASVSAPYTIVDSGKICYYYVNFSCLMYPPRMAPGLCYLAAEDCVNICTLDGGFFDCSYGLNECADGTMHVEAGAPVTVACGVCANVGRRPAGLRSAPEKRHANPLGEYFARASYLEAASVHAFLRLKDELAAHRAPTSLVRAAARSARDEVRHARAVGRLARRFSSEAPRARVRRRPVRSLEGMARENVVEGCVRETFGAMVALWETAHARDEAVRRCLRRIVADEARHAALASAVAEWAETRLDTTARARLDRARRQAVTRLDRELATELPRTVIEGAGLPSPEQARALLAEMTRTLG